MRKDVIYIAGKVSGADLEETKRKFQEAEDWIWEWLTYEKDDTVFFFKIQNIINPTRLGLTFKDSWLKCMIICIYNLLKCNAIYMLSDWKDSDGACIEYWIAKKLGYKIYYQTKQP